MRKVFVLCSLMAAMLLTAYCSNAQSVNLSVSDFEKAISQKTAQVLDVRTKSEYQSGHIANALQTDWTNDKEFTDRVKLLDKSKPVYTYCLSGVRSHEAAVWLNKNGFKAYNLAGGIIAWKRAGKPVQKL